MEAESEKMSMSEGQRLAKIIVGPSQAFEAIRENPRFLVPAVIVLVFSLACTALTLPEILALAKEAMTASGQSADQMETILKMTGVSALIGVLITVPLVWLVKSLVLLVYNQLSTAEANFKQLFAVAVYSSIPRIFSQVISTAVVKSAGYKAALQVNNSLGLLMGGNTEGFLYRFLSQVELFSVWGLLLLILGGSIMMKKRAVNVGIYVAALWLLLAVGLAALGGLVPATGLK